MRSWVQIPPTPPFYVVMEKYLFQLTLMHCVDWNLKEEFIEKMYRRSRSIHSKRYYSFGIDKFRGYCEEKNLDVNQENVYSVLDSFVGWLDKKEIKPKTIANYVSAVRKFLPHTGITIEQSAFKAKVVLPRVTKIEDEPLTLENVRILLTKGRPNPKLRALILTLLSSGMRIGEALSIKVNDVTLDSSPVIVAIRSQYTKTGAKRVAYVSDEAKEALHPIISNASKDNLVFQYSGDLWQREKVAVRTFRDIANRAGLGDKIEGHRIHKIHFHSFRKFFLTKAVDMIGDHAGHALCGHGFYMDTYYKKSEEERKNDYLKLMPYLAVFGKEEKVDVRKELAKQLLLLSGHKSEEVEAMNVSQMTDEEIQQKVKQRLLGALTNNGHRQKVIPASQVKKSINQGWEYVAQLPDGDAIVKLPSD